MPEIKHPPVIDISHWIEVPDFRALDPLPWLIITKATEGTGFLDATYAEYADSIRETGIRLGAYHFMLPGDEIAQADWFCEILLTVGLRGDEILACDMEVNGVSLQEIKNFLDRVQVKTGIRPLIYSSQLRLEGLYPNRLCPEWLKGEWLWIAEYPAAPDLTDEIPGWIVPRGCSVNRIAAWQYTDDGILGGIPGNNVDLNLINPIYAHAIGLAEPIPGGVSMSRYFRLNTTAANIRSSNTANSTDLGDLARDDVVQVEEILAGWSRFVNAQHADGGPVLLANGTPVFQYPGPMWSTNAYFVEVSALPNPPAPPPDPDPDPTPQPEDLVITQAFSSPGYVPQTVTTILKPE